MALRMPLNAPSDQRSLEPRFELQNQKLSLEEINNTNSEIQRWHGKPFAEWLASQNISDHLRNLLTYAIALDHSNNLSTLEALQNAHSLLASLGRYTDSPFILPVYGTSELAQAFTRQAAVNGAIYMLQQRVKAFVVSNEKFVAIILENDQVVTAEHFVIESRFLPPSNREFALRRAVCITNQALSACESAEIIEPQSFVIFPPRSINENQKHALRAYQTNSTLSACPDPLFVVHLSYPILESPDEAVVEQAIEQLFAKSADVTQTAHRPRLYYSAMYSIVTQSTNLQYSNLIVSPPTLNETKKYISSTLEDATFDEEVEWARQTFDRLFVSDNCEAKFDFIMSKRTTSDDSEQQTFSELDALNLTLQNGIQSQSHASSNQEEIAQFSQPNENDFDF